MSGSIAMALDVARFYDPFRSRLRFNSSRFRVGSFASQLGCPLPRCNIFKPFDLHLSLTVEPVNREPDNLTRHNLATTPNVGQAPRQLLPWKGQDCLTFSPHGRTLILST